MKRITSLFLVLLSICTWAQTPMYFNSNTVGGSNSIPFNSGGNLQWRRTQFCIPAGNLGAVAPGNNITTIYFQASTAANITYPNLYVRLKTATAAGMTGVANGPFETNMVQVFHGVNFQMNTSTGGWVAIQLQTPFLYDPTFPLIVDFEHDHPSAVGPSVSQPGTIATGNGRQWGYNNGGLISGVGTNLLNFGIDVIPATPCNGAPPANSVSPLTFSTCPGTWNPGLKFASTYSLGGLEYQWYESVTSHLGPWTPVSGATLATAPVPTLGVTTWFQAVATCTNLPNASTSLTAAHFYVEQNTLVNNAPYHEDFESVPMDDRLPNCSWFSAELGSSALTYTGANTMNRAPRSGSKFAAFKNNPTGTSYFYSNGINLSAGVTYSASVWYQSDLTGANNWSDFSIMLGTSQSAAGLTTIASTGGPAISLIYKPLSGTFTVPNSGIYYIAVKATGASGPAEYLSWDDLSVEIPCALNKPAISLNASKTTICQGENITLTAVGADDFTWDNNGGSGGNVVVSPQYNTLYTATGTNTISGCQSNAAVFITVNASPKLYVITSPATACENQPLYLLAAGADTYAWSTGDNGSSTMVKPAVSTSYTVSGTNQVGCTSNKVVNITVHSNPEVAVSGLSKICLGESTVLNGSNAVSYKWKANNVYISDNPVSVSPKATTAYTVVGTDLNGCTGEKVHVVSVDACTGIDELSQTGAGTIYPNPASDLILIEIASAATSTYEITDLAGRVVGNGEITGGKTSINISALAAGLYSVKIQSQTGTELLRFVKE